MYYRRNSRNDMHSSQYQYYDDYDIRDGYDIDDLYDYDFNDDYVIGAYVRGGPLASEITGQVFFEPAMGGSQVFATFYGLPDYMPASNGNAPIGPLGFHLHEFANCSIGNPESPFEAAGGHWNPTNAPHGNHAGDFPVIFSNNGYSNISFFTNKFRPEDVVGKSVIIHQNPDDYRSQPSGAAGKRLACGVVGYIREDD